MTPKERILSVYQREKTDQVPWGAYHFPPGSIDIEDSYLPRGETERKLRERGCALIALMPVWKVRMPKVEVLEKQIWENNEKVFLRIYRTPEGEVYEKIKTDPRYKSKWIKEFLIKEQKDYGIVKFIIRNMVFEKNYDDFLECQKNIGEDGLVIAYQSPLERSPLQKLFIDLAGIEKTSLDLYDNLDLIEDFLNCLEKKKEETLEIEMNSPAEVIFLDENITSDITSPRLFSKYCLPFYKKYFSLLHQKGKICLAHFDGKLNALKDLIKNTDIDVMDSFTLPGAGGDLPLEEARRIWPDKTIVINLPAFLCFKKENEIEKYLKNLFEKEVTRNNFMIEVSEDLPHKFWKKALGILAKVIEEIGGNSL